MKDYVDYIAYPIMLFAVYVLIGLINWSSDPGTWSIEHRLIWITWGMSWGFAMRLKINNEVLFDKKLWP